MSVDQVPDGNCSFFHLPRSATSGTPSSKLLLETADQTQRWTMYLRIPNLPASAIGVGDKFDVTLTAASAAWFQIPYQEITLSRNGQPFLFAYAGHHESQPAPGVMITDAGVTCSIRDVSCGFAWLRRAVNVVNGAASAVVQEGETAQIGNLSFTLSLDDTGIPEGGCDPEQGTELMGGFITPP